MSFFVSPSGNDNNDGLSWATALLTLQKAVDLAPESKPTAVSVADGSYAGDVNVMYYKLVSFIGNHANPDNVVISGATCFTAQDDAILTVSDMKLLATSTGIYGRQNAIIDVNSCHYGAMSIGVSATEKSKINVSNMRLDGNMAYVIAASGQSQLNLGNNIAIPNPISVSAFAYAAWQSEINASAANFTNPGNVTGLSYINDSSLIIRPPGGFPGSIVGSIVQNGGVME